MKSNRFPLQAVCLAGFIGAFLNMLLMFSPVVWNVGNWYPAFVCVSTVLEVIALGGLWLSRPWALPLYVLYAVLNQTVHLLIHRWRAAILILPLVTLSVAIFYIRKKK
ncbi:MAG: hypothetical protein ACREL1_06075 [bacterium]